MGIHKKFVAFLGHQMEKVNNLKKSLCEIKSNFFSSSLVLASGGNDNILNLWTTSGNSRVTETTPIHSFS